MSGPDCCTKPSEASRAADRLDVARTVFKMFKSKGTRLIEAAKSKSCDCDKISQLIDRGANVHAVDKARGLRERVGFWVLGPFVIVRAVPGQRRARCPAQLARYLALIVCRCLLAASWRCTHVLLVHARHVQAPDVCGLTHLLPLQDGRTPLYWAASLGHAAAAELLLKHGADVNVADKARGL